MILIGSGGYLGHILAKHFSTKLSRQLTCVSRSFQWAKLVDENRIICSASSIDNYNHLIKPDSQIIYMAGSTNLLAAEESAAKDLISHVDEMQGFLKAINQLKDRPKRIIFFSSGGTVYGDSKGAFCSELSLLAPKSIYGTRNCLLEIIFQNYCELMDIDFSVFRISNPFGPYQFMFKRKGLIQTLLQSSLTGNEITLRSGGRQIRDYIYADTFCTAVEALLRIEDLPRVINIASGYSTSGLNIIEFLNQMDIYPVVKYTNTERVFEVSDSILDNQLMCKLLQVNSDILNPLTKKNIESMIGVSRTC